MKKLAIRLFSSLGAIVSALCANFSIGGYAAELVLPTDVNAPRVAEASNEGLSAIPSFQVAEGFQVDLVAAEPHLANPVAFTIDEKGRFYVAETFRHTDGVLDIRGRLSWLHSSVRAALSEADRRRYSDELLDADLSSRTVDQRISYLKRYMGDEIIKMTQQSERISLITDRDGDGIADTSSVFADGFSEIADGIGAGLLARGGKVWFANLPNLWMLQDDDGDGISDNRKSLHYGYGVRTGFLGHDLHGLCAGPYGKIYFSIGDRGTHINTFDGRLVSMPDTGAVFRCNPDGSELEIFAFGLRNPQELAFDEYGDLFTGDNNSDGGDQARWVYVVEGGDSGWRIGYQFLNRPVSRGVWNSEKMWHPRWEGQAAYLNPPIANLGNGPSGLVYYPGTGLTDAYRNTFFLVDFKGSRSASGIYAVRVKRKGAGFELEEPERFIWGVLATDADFGYNGGLYFTDWVEGWGKPAKGRIYRIHNPALDESEVILKTSKLMAEGLSQHGDDQLSRLLAHRDMRIRREAQCELVSRGVGSVSLLTGIAKNDANRMARIHAIWGLTQLAEKYRSKRLDVVRVLTALFADSDAEIRNQAARSMGRIPERVAYDGLISLLSDESARVRYSACMSLGKLGVPEALPAILATLRENNDTDATLRHAGVMALTWIHDISSVMEAADSENRSVRLASLLAMRRWKRPEIAQFLKDADPFLVREAALAINDVPIDGAMLDLAQLTDSSDADASILRRAINANFRLGDSLSAGRLVKFALDSSHPEKLKTEALNALAEWATPSGRDHVTGVWRPLYTAVRDGSVPADALRTHTDALAESARRGQDAAVNTIVNLNMTDLDDVLAELAVDSGNNDRTRVAALRGLERLDSSRLGETLESMRSTDSETLRVAMIDVSTRVNPQTAVALLRDALAEGRQTVKKGALSTLARLRGSAADKLAEEWLDVFLTGKAEKELHLEILDAAEGRGSASIQSKLQRHRSVFPRADSVRGYSELLYGGNRRNGRTIFREKLEVSCIRCHKRDGEGGEAGPVLDDIGTRKNRDYILESMLFPNASIAEGFATHNIETNDGDMYSGTLVEENDQTLVLNSFEGGRIEVPKNEIAFRKQGLSGMPEGVADILTKHELRDLVEYLASRRSGLFRRRN